MCGILGCVERKVEKTLFIDCLNRMEHRGPDGYGVYENKDVILGHRRLSILDLSDKAKQPMEYANGRYVITYNGEIYNFIELRKELESYGFTFNSSSDTEVILASFIKWKEKCLNHFNGMWAFAIWDNYEKKLFLARDRFGIKPLFWSKMKDGGFVFASEMKAIVPFLEKVSINDVLLKDDIMNYECTEECLIKEIHRLPLGCFAFFSEGDLSIKKWWNTYEHIPQVNDDYNTQVEQFRELFIDACRIRMRSDVTLGTALSGGLDSSATICAMAKIANDKHTERVNTDFQHAFVACFPNTILDETKYAEQVTNYLGIDASFINISGEKYIDHLEDYLYCFEENYNTTPIPMMVTYEEMKKNGVSVSLDGHGADELFGGYSFDLFEAFYDAKNEEEIKQIINAYENISQIQVVKPGEEHSFYKKYLRDRRKQKLLDWINRTQINNNNNIRSLDHLNQRLYFQSQEHILPTLLRNYDRYSMNGSVEIRMPFMDYRIVEFAFAIGWKSKIRNGYTKSIIRDAMEPYMPHDIVYRKNKIGFNTPLVEWMQGCMKEYLEDVICSEDFRTFDILDTKAVKEKVLNVINGGTNVTFGQAGTAWTEISPYLWKKAFFDRVSVV